MLDSIPTWVAVTGTTVAALYLYLKSRQRVFARKGIPGPSPWLIVGNSTDMMKKGMKEYALALKEKYGNVVGIYLGSKPSLLVFDLDMIKEVNVKQFQNFQNHTHRDFDMYPMGKMLHMLEFDHWKHVRNALTPSFSGGKLRKMTNTINKCCETWTNSYVKAVETGEVVEMTSSCQHLTMALIANVAFGLDLRADEKMEEDFIKHAKTFFSLKDKMTLKLLLLIIAPKLSVKLGIPIIPQESVDFFVHAVNQTMSLRGSLQETEAKDFLQLLVDSDVGEPTEKDMATNPELVKSNKGAVYSKKGLTREEILASAMLFFLAGYDTVSLCMSFLFYSLACNPDVQDKLYQEISDVMDGKDSPDYDLIKQMPYLQMAIDETLRLYPPAPMTDRGCNQDCEINGLKVEKGMNINIPIMAIHYDPDIWPEPEKFDPERFTAEAKADRHPMAYLPFGQGPRMCIGNRLALMEVKFAVISLLRKYKIVQCAETQVPLELTKIRITAVNGIKVKLEPRI